MVVGTLLGTIPFILAFLAVCVSAYYYIFCNDLIPSYSVFYISKDQINSYVDRNINVNARGGDFVIPLNTEDIGDDGMGGVIEGGGDDEDTDVLLFKEKQKLETPSSLGTESNILRQLPSYLALGVLFSITIGLCVQLILLMLSEVIEFSSEESRLVLFHFTLNLLVFLLTLVLPFILFNLLVNNNPIHIFSFSSKIRLTIITSCMVGWFVLLSRFGTLSQSFTPIQLYNRSLLEWKINEISIGGIVTLAILLGVGSTSTAFKLYLRVRHGTDGSGTVSVSSINYLIRSYNNTTGLLHKRQHELQKLVTLTTNGTVYNNGNIQEGAPKSHRRQQLLNKVQSFASLGSSLNDEEETSLNNEIKSLQMLRLGIYHDIVKQINQYVSSKSLKINKEEQDVLQKLNTGITIGFGAYCTYRIITVLLIRLPYFLLLKTESKPSLSTRTGETQTMSEDNDNLAATVAKDALAITISKMVSAIITLPISEKQLVNQLSFILSGSLFIGSISNVLTTFRSISKAFPLFFINENTYTKGTMHYIKHLVMGELFGIYVIATALLIRTNLPSTMSYQVSKVLSLLGGSNQQTLHNISIQEVALIDEWFDKIFGASCLITLFLIAMQLFVNDKSGEDYDEEMVVEGKIL